MHEANLLDDQPIAWTPTPDVIERAQLTKFMRQVGISTWDELYQFSIRDVEKFTEEVLKFLDIKFDPPYEKLLDKSKGVEFPEWLSRSADTPVRMSVASTRTSADSPELSIGPDGLAGGTGDADKSVRAPAGLNITTMCLDRWQTDEMKDQPAVIWEGESGNVETFSYEEMHSFVVQVAESLIKAGFRKGDAIGIHMPMIPETINALLAINRIGAIAVPVFSGYGVDAIASRLKAVGVKALFTAENFSRRGKLVDSLATAIEAVSNCETIEKVYVTNCSENFDISARTQDGRFCSFYSLFSDTTGSSPARTSAEDPLIILYTSGTTGKPKGIAHTHASFPIKAAQDMAFGTDVGRGTRICWYTDIGWMMGPWLIYGALINGATICIYDGAPDYPTPDRMWEFCARHKVEVLGISPTLIRSLARSGDTLVPIGGSYAENPSERRSDVHGDTSVPAPTERRGWYRSKKLPHFDGEVTQFITFRLADSLPQGVLDRLKLQLEHDKLSDDSEEYRQRVEDYLDQGAGECLLRHPEIARIVSETILYEHERSCDLKAWVVMPNHAHLLLRMRADETLGGLMKRIKGVSSRKINQHLGREGSVWQAHSFDRYIRDSEPFIKVVRSSESNPVVARLSLKPEEWRFGSAYGSGDTPVPIGGSSAENPSERRSDVHGDKSVPAPSLAPFERHDLSALRIFASTGEPWNPAPWWWLFEKVGNSKLPIINYSGGTEIAGGILMGNPLLPQKPCSFPAPCPGMDVDILDEEGNPVEPGKVGELVIKQPWIGMARGFWQEKERYLETYWRRFKDIWVHGDWAMRDRDGHWFILGRSDDTLKVAGKRVGPAEIEGLLVAHPLVTEAAVIGVPDEAKGTAMVAFVVRSGVTLVPTDDASSFERIRDKHEAAEKRSLGDKSVPAPSVEELKALVAKDMGKPLSPSKIYFVSALPKTRNAKVMRRVIRAAYLGEDPGDLTALENPESIFDIRNANK